MFPGEDLLQEGIAAFQAGDRTKAHELLLEVVKVDPENEQAWYYLAASESNPATRKQYLEQVLEINPSNAKAREVLERMKAREVAQPVSAPVSPAGAAPSTPPSGVRRSPLRPLDPSLEPPPGAADNQPGSFKVPFHIPGAPERTTWETLARDGVAMVRGTLDVILRKPGAYSDEVARATWWRFWLLAGTAAVGSGILSIFNALFLQIRYSNSLFSIFAVLLTPFFFVAVALFTLYVGCYASYRYALAQGGSSSLLKHAYSVAVVWAPIVLVNSALSFVFNLFGLGGWLTTLLLNLYSLYLISEGFQNLRVFREPNQKWITAAVMVVAEIAISVIIGVIFGGLIVAGALPFAL
jgi:hypothetical protein